VRTGRALSSQSFLAGGGSKGGFVSGERSRRPESIRALEKEARRFTPVVVQIRGKNTRKKGERRGLRRKASLS